MRTGFIISFLGAFPFGYLNLIALQVFASQSWGGVLLFILGAISVEFWAIYFTFWGAEKLLSKTKLVFWIDVFSVVFLLGFSVSFLQSEETKQVALPAYLQGVPPFVLGLVWNGLNFVQLTFWSGWNVFVIQKNWVRVEDIYWYILGALLGTTVGVCLFVWLSHYWIASFNRYVFAGLFFMLALVPLWKLLQGKKKVVVE